MGGGTFNQKNKALQELLSNKHYFLRNHKNSYLFRNRLTEIPNLGLAKASFAAELLHPLEKYPPVCLDTHVLQWLGHKKLNGKMTEEQYTFLEKEFHSIAPYSFITRNILWDNIQKQSNPRYWSYILEKNEIHNY